MSFTVQYGSRRFQLINSYLKGVTFDNPNLQVSHIFNEYRLYLHVIRLGNITIRNIIKRYALQTFHMKHGSLVGTQILTRYVYFPLPIKTDLLRLNILEGSSSLAVKIDLLGTTPDKSHRSDSMFEKLKAENSKCIRS